MRVVRYDRGGEYYRRYDEIRQHPSLFGKLLQKHNICAQYIMPNIPQQIGVSKRCYRTLMYMVKSMLSNLTLPVSLWMYALKTTMHLLNRISSKAVPKTPFELWTNKTLSKRHLKVWGC